jgi:hypothetical protein
MKLPGFIAKSSLNHKYINKGPKTKITTIQLPSLLDLIGLILAADPRASPFHLECGEIGADMTADQDLLEMMWMHAVEHTIFIT